MPRSTSPLCIEHFVQGQHDTTNKAEVDALTFEPKRGLDDASSLASTRSTTSHHYIPGGRSPKQQLLYCLERYQSLAHDGLSPGTAKEAVLWCCLGLGVVITSSPASSAQLQSPLSPESRSSSNGSLSTISDSGFAPSVEARTRHGLSLGDPDVENSMTNLIGGLTGAFTSSGLERHDVHHGLFLPDVGDGFDVVLSHFNLAKGREIEDMAAFAVKTAAQLLDVLQNECNVVCSDTLGYWELCLKVVISSSNKGDANTSNIFKSHLTKQAPPPSLCEPALSSIIKLSSAGEPNDAAPFPILDPTLKAPHFIPRFQRQTRSRAASLMSHSSLRSFSSVRSLGGLSSKSPATLSLSHDFGFARSSSPSGSFIIESPVSALDALDSLAHSHQVLPQRRRVLVPGNDHPVTAPSSPLRPTAPTISRSNTFSSGNLSTKGKGKGKENHAELPQEGLRPGLSNVSVRTGTRFVMTCPPTPSGGSRSGPLPKMDPVLAALERGSKFKSKSLCLNCGEKGSNYPCCPRCGETWCSRECRIEANKGGKHMCKRSATLPSI